MRQGPDSVALSSDGSNVLISYVGAILIVGRESGNRGMGRVPGSGEAGVTALSADDRLLIQGTESGALNVWRAVPAQ